MKGLGTIAIIFAIFATFTILPRSSAKNDDKAIMCYFGSWSTYRWSTGYFDVESIDPFLCTHLVYGFAGTYIGSTGQFFSQQKKHCVSIAILCL